jgi:hypothetical protein
MPEYDDSYLGWRQIQPGRPAFFSKVQTLDHPVYWIARKRQIYCEAMELYDAS